MSNPQTTARQTTARLHRVLDPEPCLTLAQYVANGGGTALQAATTLDRSVILEAGDILMAPKGIPHSYIVESQEGAQWITVTTGGDFEAMVRETARPATAAGLPEAAHPTPEMIAAVDAACARSRIRLVGAPLAA